MSGPSVATVEGLLTEAYRRTFGNGDFNAIVRLLDGGCAYRQQAPRGYLRGSGANAVCLGLVAWQQAFKDVRLSDLAVYQVPGVQEVPGATACHRIDFVLHGETAKALPGLDFAMRLGRRVDLAVTHIVWTTVKDGRLMILAMSVTFDMGALK